jgi:hypothetical protein
MQNALLIMPLWFCAIASWSLGVYILALKRHPEFRSFALTTISVGIYCGGYAGELYSKTVEGMLFWSKLQYVGIAFQPAFWMEFVLRYTGRRDLLKSSLKYVLWGFPLVTIFFKLFDDSAFLIYKSVSLDRDFNTLKIEPGPWYYVALAYSYICGLGGVIVFMKFGFKRMGIQRKNAIILAIVTLIPIAANVVYLSSHSPFGSLDLAPFSLVAVIFILYIAVIRNDLLNLAPVAREFAFEHLPQGLLIFDKRRRLCEANESARALLALGPDCIGEASIGVFTPMFEQKALPDSGKTVFETSINGRDLEVHTTIIDNEDKRLGWIVTLIDISERKRMEARLEQLLKNRPLQSS